MRKVPFLLALLATPLAAETPVERIQADIVWLADDAREGRGLGTAGLRAAEKYLAGRFAELGLENAGDLAFDHEFEAAIAVVPGPSTALALDSQNLPRNSFEVASFSTNGSIEGAVVIAGYGISAPELEHDDYKDLEVAGKIVAVRRFVPKGARFADDAAQRRYGDLRYKAWNARQHGAAGLLVVDWPALAPGEAVPDEAPLPNLRVDTEGDAGLPVLVLKREAGVRLFDGQAHVAKVTAELQVSKEKARNIIGKISANGERRKSGQLLVGAHFDHLGLGGHGSLMPDVHEPHNGADDNASGTAAVLEIARQIKARAAELERDVYFVAFSGEESGLLGSTALTRRPTGGLEITHLNAMINLDMVGRLRAGRVQALGGGSANEWGQIVPPLCALAELSCELGGDGYGPSDQTPFYAAGVPVLHFFTGTHEDYHKPTDDSGKVNAQGVAQIADVVADLLIELGKRPEKLTYVRTEAPPPSGDQRSYGAALGTIPDYVTDGQPGVKVAGTRPGSAAEKAGILPGDRLIRLGDSEIRDIYDFVFVLRQAKPGDKVKGVVVRGDQNIELEIIYDESRRRP